MKLTARVILIFSFLNTLDGLRLNYVELDQQVDKTELDKNDYFYNISSCEGWNQFAKMEFFRDNLENHWACEDTSYGMTLTGGDYMPDQKTQKKEVVFWHLEKGGGSAMISYLRKALGRDSKLHIVDEFGQFSEQFWKDDYFKIGLIREPCSYYNSLYHWGPRHGHALAYDLFETKRASNFYAPKNKEHFGAFLRHILGGDVQSKCGVLSMRTWTQVASTTAMQDVNNDIKSNNPHPCSHSHKIGKPCPAPLGDFVRDVPKQFQERCNLELRSSKYIDDMDCWLRTNNLNSDFAECLHKFAAAGGQLSTHFDPIAQKKVNANGHPECSDMYDPDLAALVEKVDGTYKKRFGFTGKCCEPHPSMQMIKPEPAY